MELWSNKTTTNAHLLRKWALEKMMSRKSVSGSSTMMSMDGEEPGLKTISGTKWISNLSCLSLFDWYSHNPFVIEHSSLISQTSSDDVNMISFDFQCSLFRYWFWLGVRLRLKTKRIKRVTQHERQDELDSMKMEDLNTRASVILTEKVSGTVGVYIITTTSIDLYPSFYRLVSRSIRFVSNTWSTTVAVPPWSPSCQHPPVNSLAKGHLPSRCDWSRPLRYSSDCACSQYVSLSTPTTHSTFAIPSHKTAIHI